MIAMTYADASFLVSLCLGDSNSAAAVAFVKSHRQPLALTVLQRHELRNAIRLAVFRTRNTLSPVTDADAHAALDRMDVNIASGSFVEHPLPWSEAMAEAERLGGAHTMTLGVRGMDLLNVAAAVATKSRVFVTFDSRQRAIARAAGLKVLP
jgi:predicted nucleic acid-binding protein